MLLQSSSINSENYRNYDTTKTYYSDHDQIFINSQTNKQFNCPSLHNHCKRVNHKEKHNKKISKTKNMKMKKKIDLKKKKRKQPNKLIYTLTPLLSLLLILLFVHSCKIRKQGILRWNVIQMSYFKMKFSNGGNTSQHYSVIFTHLISRGHTNKGILWMTNSGKPRMDLSFYTLEGKVAYRHFLYWEVIIVNRPVVTSSMWETNLLVIDISSRKIILQRWFHQQWHDYSL